MLINLKVEYRERYIVRKPELIGRERERKRKNKQSFKMNALCIWLCKDLDQSNRLNEFQKNKTEMKKKNMRMYVQLLLTTSSQPYSICNTAGFQQQFPAQKNSSKQKWEKFFMKKGNSLKGKTDKESKIRVLLTYHDEIRLI